MEITETVLLISTKNLSLYTYLFMLPSVSLMKWYFNNIVWGVAYIIMPAFQHHLVDYVSNIIFLDWSYRKPEGFV